MNRIEVLHLPVGKPLTKVAIDRTSLEDMYRLTNGGPVEHVAISATIDMYCNEEGKLTGLPFNFFIVDNDQTVTDVIHGDVFFCGYDMDGELKPLTQTEETFVRKLFSKRG